MKLTKTAVIFSMFFLFSSFRAECQLDSISVSVSFENYAISDSITVPDMLMLTLQFDDINDLGYLNVVVYDNTSGSFMLEFVRTREELINEGLLLPNAVKWPLVPLFPDITYRVEVSPRNLAGAYTRIGSAIIAN
jgi:hypothetical protein